MAELTEPAAVRRLHDRLGFGLGGSRLAAAQQQGFDSAAARLLAPAAVDFRAVYATMLDKVLGTDPARILGGFAGQVERLIE